MAWKKQGVDTSFLELCRYSGKDRGYPHGAVSLCPVGRILCGGVSRATDVDGTSVPTSFRRRGTQDSCERIA